MIRTTFAACGVFAIVTGVMSAQTPTQTKPTMTPPDRPETPQTMTLTGCLKPWDATTMGAASGVGETGTSRPDSSPQFVLTNAAYAAAPVVGATTPGTSMPSTTGTPAMGAHSTYLLKAQSASVNLAAHVNHKVEVTGTMAIEVSKPMGTGTSTAPASAAATGASPATGTSTTGTTTTRPSSGDATRHPSGTSPVKTAFTVTALKMIDKTCS